MENIYENLIEYCGVSEYIPKDILCYKEFNVDSIINLNKDNVKMQEVIKVNVFPNIKSTRVINTPRGVSLEGECLTGEKYIMEGEINIRLDYISEDNGNKIYCYNYKKNFASSMVLHKDMINRTVLIPSIFIEGINVQLINTFSLL
ncbi:MAG: hypothetical protein ACRDA5_08055, partial [Clostridium sp.]